jgi:hypothetical protein
MESIIRLFKDPGWWFTAVFIGILASLLAAYLRDGISSLAALTSTTFRVRRDRRLAAEQTRIHLLAKHPDLLLAELIRCTIRILCFIGMLIIFICFPVAADTMGKLDQQSSSNPLGIDFVRRIVFFCWLVIGVLVCFMAFHATRRVKIAAEAREEYERLCKLDNERDAPAA